MDRSVLRCGWPTVAVFTAGLLAAAAVVRLLAALADVTPTDTGTTGDLPGNPNHPTKHECQMKGCDEIYVAGTSCVSGTCYSADYGTRFKKCWPVLFDSSCHETAANGSEVCDYLCDTATNSPLARPCHVTQTSSSMSFNRCAPVVLGEPVEPGTQGAP